MLYLLLIFLSTINIQCMENDNAIFNLSEDDHMDRLIYFSQRGNAEKVSYIIENENESNKKNRRSILYEFGYVSLLCDFNDEHFLNRENNMRAYRAMRKEDTVPNIHFFYSKAFVGSLPLIKIFSKNVDLKNITFGQDILLWPILVDDEKFAKFLLDSGMNVSNEALDGFLTFTIDQNHPNIANILRKWKSIKSQQ